MKRILSVFLLILLCCGCGKEMNTIKIGAILPLTGDAAQWGIGAKRGIEIAKEEYIQKTNMLVDIIYEDDKLLPKEGVNAAKKLVEIDKVSFIIGSISSSVTQAITPYTERNKVIMISPASTSHLLSSSGAYFFRTIPSDIIEGRYMAEYVIKKEKLTKLSIIAVNSAGTIGMANSFKDKIEQSGGQILGDELVAQGQTDFRGTLSKLISKKPEGIYIVGFPLEIGYIIKQLKELGYSGRLFAPQPAEDPQVKEIAREATQGLTYSTTTIKKDNLNKVGIDFFKKYKEKYGVEPEIFSYEAYDACAVLLEVVGKGTRDISHIIDLLHNIKDFQGASGIFSFDKNGDVIKEINIVNQ